MKFEYMTLKVVKGVIFQSKNDTTVNLDKEEVFQKVLNERGADGWELIQVILGIDGLGYAIFKRQVN